VSERFHKRGRFLILLLISCPDKNLEAMFSIWLLMEHYRLFNNGSPFTSPCSTFWSFVFPCTWVKGSSLLVSRLLCMHRRITKFWFTSHTWSVQNLTMIRIYETWSRCCGIALQGFAGRFDHYISTLKSDKGCNHLSLYIAGKTCLKLSVTSKTVAFYVVWKVTSDHRMSNITSYPYINKIALKTSQKCLKALINMSVPAMKANMTRPH
jgi:hypothetical protein